MAALIRIILVTALLGGVVVFGFWGLTLNQDRRMIRELEAMNREMAERLKVREAMISRLSRSRRLAHVHVLNQQRDEEGRVTETTVRFIELDDVGVELARDEFTLPGQVVFIDAWTVKFTAEDVAHGHPLRGKTLVLLRRIYSDRMAPMNGLPIDTPGAVPPGYAASEMGEYEKKVWDLFWDIATDAELARSMGVRVAQGEAVYKPVTVGQGYELMVDAVGGISLRPMARDRRAAAGGMLKQADESTAVR